MFCLTNKPAEIFDNDWTVSLKIRSRAAEDLLLKISGQLAVEISFSSLIAP